MFEYSMEIIQRISLNITAFIAIYPLGKKTATKLLSTLTSSFVISWPGNMIFLANFLNRVLFRSQAVLHRHINTVHLKKSFTCEICGASFGLLSGLRGHIDKVHNKDKWRKQCSVCQRWLSTPETLASHMRTHTGEKPYKQAAVGYTTMSLIWFNRLGAACNELVNPTPWVVLTGGSHLRLNQLRLREPY